MPCDMTLMQNVNLSPDPLIPAVQLNPVVVQMNVELFELKNDTQIQRL